MATVMQKKKKARGHQNKQTKITDTMPNDDESAAEEMMTQEDKLLLKGVKDDDDVSDVEIDVSGNDVSETEINSFLQKLGVEKYRPFPVLQSGDKPQSKDLKNKTNVENAGNKKDKGSKQTSHDLSNSKSKISKNGVSKAKSVSNPEEVQSVMKFLEVFKTRKHLLLKPEEMWREEQVQHLPVVSPDEKLASAAENLAQRLLEQEVSLYSKQRDQSKRSEARWLKTVLGSGTLSDKMAALTLLIQESPVHNLTSLDSLTSMAKKKGRREAMMAVDTLRDMFLTGLLPDDRKLKAFVQQPLMKLLELTSGNIDARDKYLVMWYFEGLIKKRYADFIKALGDMSFDTLQATKEKALSSIHQLLTSKPEQENTLLPMLVNKLGDPSMKSKATYLLTKLVDEHPNMKHVIVREVQQLLHRPNVSQRSQYYAICFLTQLRLGHIQSDLASQLIQIYFYFFRTYLTQGDVDNKMMSALLTGVNRAYVYAKGRKEDIVEQMDAVYKIIPNVNFHTSVQALMLLYQVSDASTNASDRFYVCLYRKLVDPALRNSSKQAIFMNLLFKSMKADIVDKRIRAFVKRTLQVYSQQQPQIICGVLILLAQLLKDKPGLLDVRHTARDTWSDDEEEKFVDLPAPEEFDAPESGNIWSHGTSGSAGEEVQHTGPETVLNNVKGSWVHRINYGGGGHSSEYDPYNRNPLYSRAELDCVWELEQLVKHYHPTVGMYARSVLQGKNIAYDGDPLQDYTLIRFLDRFVYKNPKKESTNSSTGHFKKVGPSGIRAVPVNSKEFLEISEERVPEDEKFFYRYFAERASRMNDGDDAGSDAGSVGDDEFDAFLDGFEKDADRDDVVEVDLDFAGDTYKSKSNDTKKKKKEVDSDEESFDSDDLDEDLDLEDEELAAEFQHEMDGLDMGDDYQDDDDDDSDVENDLNSSSRQLGPVLKPFTGDDETSMMRPDGRGRKRKKQQADTDSFEAGGVAVSQKRKKHDVTDLFASAEEFAHLLEEDTETGKISLGGTGDFRNKDKAAQKQLMWEADRDRWMNKKAGRNVHRKKDADAGGGGAKRGKSSESLANNRYFKNNDRKNVGKKFNTGRKKFQNKKKK